MPVIMILGHIGKHLLVSTVFYHCIRHAILLSIVLALLSSIFSAILYNFNE